MQLPVSQVSLSEVGRFLEFKGHYRLLTVRINEDYLTDAIEFILTISDGESTLKLSAFKNVRLPIGGFVYIEAQYQRGDYWRVTKLRLSTTEEALTTAGFRIDRELQKRRALMPVSFQLQQLSEPAVLVLKDFFIENYCKEKRLQDYFIGNDEAALKQTISWFLAIDFEHEKQRDFAIVGTILWRAFERFINPHSSLSSEYHDIGKYRDFIAQAITTLGKLDESLCDFFERVMQGDSMLHIKDSKLHSEPSIRSLEVAFFHAISVEEFKEELRYA